MKSFETCRSRPRKGSSTPAALSFAWNGVSTKRFVETRHSFGQTQGFVASISEYNGSVRNAVPANIARQNRNRQMSFRNRSWINFTRNFRIVDYRPEKESVSQTGLCLFSETDSAFCRNFPSESTAALPCAALRASSRLDLGRSLALTAAPILENSEAWARLNSSDCCSTLPHVSLSRLATASFNGSVNLGLPCSLYLPLLLFAAKIIFLGRPTLAVPCDSRLLRG